MRTITGPLAILLLAVSTAWAAPTREVRMRSVDVASGAPADLVRPEGRSRWDARGATLDRAFALAYLPEEGGMAVREVDANDPRAVTATSYAGPDAARWLLPDREGGLRMGKRDSLLFAERGARGAASVVADVATVGIGWIELPSGPREVVLQRWTLLREPEGASAFVPDRSGWRWIDPRAGVVAEVSGPAAADGRGVARLDRASVLEEVIAGAADLKIYVDQIYKPDNVDLNWGWDRGAVAVSSLTPDGFGTMGALVNANTWDFSQNASGLEVAQIQTPLNAQETCNTASCGYNVAGASLGRQDKFNGTSIVRRDNQVTVRENRPGDVTIWARAGAQKEGQTGAFGTGETRFCYQTVGGTTRNPVPLWRFAHQDANGWYMQPGDSFSGGPGGSCQQTLFNGVCGDTSGLFAVLYAKSCSNAGGQVFNGTQGGTVLKSGVVKLPSGHTLNAMVTRTVGEFCVYSDPSCIFKFNEVRTVVYLWSVPYLGTVVLLQSPQEVDDYTSWSTTENTMIMFGLFPPISITATGQTDTTVALAWNPGNDVRKISRYKVYWDTDPGASSAYAFNSDTHPGQVAFGGTTAAPTATVSGLAPGTAYYFTITSVSDHTDPTRSDTADIPRTYESIKYPTQVSGDPAFVYPVEVQAVTTGGTCIPTAQVTGLTVNKAAGACEFCWNPVVDACLQGYDILGADNPNSEAGFTIVGQVGAATCWQGTPPTQRYFLVVARGTGGSGPWGHFNR